MASKRKPPSFEIPANVRRAGQAGWVYRTDAPHGKRRARRAGPAAAKAPAPAVTIVEAVVPPVAPPAEPPAPSPNVAGRLVGLGLQVAAVPFMVPLFLTAAVSRRLGTTGGQ